MRLVVTLLAAFVVATAPAAPALAAPQTFACTFDRSTMIEELRSPVNEIVVDLDTQILEMHAPEGSMTYDHALTLARGMSMAETEGTIIGGGISGGKPFAFRLLPSQEPGHRTSFTWTELRADSRADESVWLCD